MAKIVDVIDDIGGTDEPPGAQRRNRSARAGEQGMGFAVVVKR